MTLPLVGLTIIAVAILRYVIGFTCGRITRDVGPMTPGTIAMILTVLACVCVCYYSLGQFVTSI